MFKLMWQRTVGERGDLCEKTKTIPTRDAFTERIALNFLIFIYASLFE
jgi:hypothetical protein